MVVSIISSISTPYMDGVYKEVSCGFRESASTSLYVLSMMLIIFMYLYLLFRHPYKLKTSENNGERKVSNFLVSKSGYYVVMLITCVSFVLLLSSCFTRIYINNTVTLSTKAMKILSCKLSRNEMNQLESLFYSIDSESDFILYKKELEKYSSQYKMKIPKF